METVVRREHSAGKAIKAIARELKVSRKVVRKTIRALEGRLFQSRLRFASLAELNGSLEAEWPKWAELKPHPEGEG